MFILWIKKLEIISILLLNNMRPDLYRLKEEETGIILLK